MPPIHHSTDATSAYGGRSSRGSHQRPTAVSGSNAISIPSVEVSYGPSVPTAIATMGLDALSIPDGEEQFATRSYGTNSSLLETRQPNFSDDGTYDFGGLTR